MFLQNLLEYDSSDFILIGERMLISDDIRYYVKYIFYEILGQIQEPDDNVIQFVVENCENEIYGKKTIYSHIEKPRCFGTMVFRTKEKGFSF